MSIRDGFEKLKFKLLDFLLPRDGKLRVELARKLLGNDIYLGWANVNVDGKRIRKLGAPVDDDDAARKVDITPGVTTFLGLTDTPDSYAGQAGKVAKVKSTEDGLEFGVAGAATFLDLTDTPSSYPFARGAVRINDDNNALEFQRQTRLYSTKPTADSSRIGEIIRVRAGAGAKTYIYVCVQNSADGYEWVQIGVST